MSFFCFHLCRGEGSPFKCRVSWLKWLLLRCGQCKVGIQVYPGSNPNPWWISRSSKTISPKFNVNKVCPSKCALEPSWISAFENHRYQTSSSNYIWEKEWLWLWCSVNRETKCESDVRNFILLRFWSEKFREINLFSVNRNSPQRKLRKWQKWR